MLGTAPATRFWIARTWSGVGSRAPTAMLTEAEGCWISSSKSSFFGRTRWTRAEVTPLRLWIVRASSPSRALWRLSCWTKSVWPTTLDWSKIS